MKVMKILKQGIIEQNGVFVQLLALCPLLAVTTSAANGIAMGIAATATMICASVVISILRKAIPNDIRIACFIVIIAAFVTVIHLLIQAYAPAIDSALGIFIPLITVNCIVFARVESFAFKNGVFLSAVDAIAAGIGFTIALFTIGFIRELFGSGSVLGFRIIPEDAATMLIMIMAPGAFFTLGAIIMVIKYRQLKKGAGD